MRSTLATVTVSCALLASVSVTGAEPTQRQRHLPFVRAASDCIANAVRRDFDFSTAVATDNFFTVIERGIKSCTSPLADMVAAHDRIYGGGGMEFFKTDYLGDLERAVRARLDKAILETRADLARRAEEQAAAEAKARADRLEADNRRKAAQAEKLQLAKQAQSLLRDRMFDCIGREGAPMLLTSERAEAVAKAAMIFCRNEVDAMTRAAVEVFEAETGAVSDKVAVREQAERTVHEIATAYVIKARGEMISKSVKPDAGAGGGTEPAASPLQRSF